MIASLAQASKVRLTERAQRWDLSVETRYSTSQDYSSDVNGDGTSDVGLEIDDDLGWGFGFAYNVNEKVNVGLLMSWRSIPYTATSSDETDPSNTRQYGGELDSGTIALMAQYNILPKTVTPYVNGGVGYTLVDTNIVADYYTGCWYDPWYGYICDGYTTTYGVDGASFALGAGLRIEPKGPVFIQIGYESDWLDVDQAEQFNIFRVDLGFTN
jgi:opacity protein-like surface antigen